MSTTCGLADPRLPLAPLWSLVERGHRPTAQQWGAIQREVPFGAVHVAEAVGVTRRCVHHWRHNGLTWDAADRAAVALGLHPANVWGDDFWASVPAEDAA